MPLSGFISIFRLQCRTFLHWAGDYKVLVSVEEFNLSPLSDRNLCPTHQRLQQIESFACQRNPNLLLNNQSRQKSMLFYLCFLQGHWHLWTSPTRQRPSESKVSFGNPASPYGETTRIRSYKTGAWEGAELLLTGLAAFTLVTDNFCWLLVLFIE